MKPEKYRRGKALRVFWVDSTSAEGWEYQTNPPVRIEEVISIGFVVNSSDVGLSLTTSLTNGGGSLALVTIPWRAITHVQSLDEWNQEDNLPVVDGVAI